MASTMATMVGVEASLVLERRCAALSSLATCCLLQFEENFAAFGHAFVSVLAMSEFFGPDLGATYPTMSIYGGPLYTEFLGPFYANGSGGSFPTTSPTAAAVSPDSVLHPDWGDTAVQDLQDIWMNPEESLSHKYRSTVERDDVAQIEELASLFVFRAKTSRRPVPYYTGLSPATTPTATPCPEPVDEATLQSASTPTHHDIKILAREEEEEDDDLKDWINGMTDDLDISSMLQEASNDLLSCTDEENLSAMTSTGQLTCGQTPESDHAVLFAGEELQSSQFVASLARQDDKFKTMDLATTNEGQTEGPFPCLLSELQPPKPGSPATELLPPAYDDACANYPDLPSNPEEPMSSKCTSVVQRDDLAEIAAVATLFVHHAKHSQRHLPYYTCQSPAGSPPSTPHLVMDGLSVGEDVQNLAERAEEEDLADWVNGMCGTGNLFMHQGEDIQGLATKVDKEDTQDFVSETSGDQSTPTPLMHQGEDIQGLATRVNKEGTQDFVNETCGDKGENTQGLAKKVDKEDTQDFVNGTCGDKSTPTTLSLMHQGEDIQGLTKTIDKKERTQDFVSETCVDQDLQDIQGLAKRVDREDTQDFVNETCGDNIQGLAKKVNKEGTQDFVSETSGDQSTPTALMHQGLATKVDKEDTQDFVNEICGDQSIPTTLMHQDIQALAKKGIKRGTQDIVNETCVDKSIHGLENKDNSLVTGMCGESQEKVPATLMGQDADIQAKKVEEDQGNLANEIDMEAKTDEPKKREGKWWDLRTKRAKMATDKTNGSNNDKNDTKKGKKWWRRASKKESEGKNSDSNSEAESRNKWWRIFRKKQSQEKGHGKQEEKITTDSRTKWWKRGNKSEKNQDGMDDKTNGKSRGWCICM
ncbi:uncharacterized protein LOC144926556 isoform X1 [Branchiostoma floridae x Branchiostoma belcheri]